MSEYVRDECQKKGHVWVGVGDEGRSVCDDCGIYKPEESPGTQAGGEGQGLPLPPATLSYLVRAYGEAMFDCGQWDEEDETDYAELNERAKDAKAALLAWRPSNATINAQEGMAGGESPHSPSKGRDESATGAPSNHPQVMSKVPTGEDKPEGKSPVPIGTDVHPWGKVAGVTNHGGERYYFFDGKGVALIPGTVVEGHHKENQHGSR